MSKNFINSVKNLTHGSSGVTDPTELLAKNNNKSNIGNVNSSIDVLSEMHSGTRLLKVVRKSNRSHWRVFKLDLTNSSISWASSKKDVSDTTIYIENIVAIISHSRQIVDKFKDTLPDDLKNKHSHDLVQQQFTIQYDDKKVNPNTNYIPQLSSNNSFTNNNNDMAMPTVPQLNVGKHSNSYIKSNKHKPIPIMQVQTNNGFVSHENSTNDGTHSYNSSATSSSSHKHHKKNTSSFFKNLFSISSSSKSSKNGYKKKKDFNKKALTIAEENKADILFKEDIAGPDSLHLIAQTARDAMIWIYGLEQLKISGSQLNHLRISLSELMSYNISISDYSIHGNGGLGLVGLGGYGLVTKIKKFQFHLKKTLKTFYDIINQLPQWQKDVLDGKKNKIFYDRDNYNNKATGTGIREEYFIRKLKIDLQELEDIILETKNSRYESEKLNKWTYMLTRIDIDCGGFQIALNNLKKKQFQNSSNNNLNEYQLYPSHQSHQSHHRRKRSKSSSIYSMNAHTPQYYVMNTIANPHPHPHSTKTSNNRLSYDHYDASFNKNILKNRSPRSPNTNTNYTTNNTTDIILRAPNNMEKFDSV